MVLPLLFTILDFSVAALMIMHQTGAFESARLLASGAAYLIGKGFLFRGSILSLLDMLVGAYLIAMIFGASTFIAYIAAGYLLYKALIFFIMR